MYPSASVPAAPPQLVEIALSVREIFERLIQSSLASRSTHGTCLYGAYLLRESLARFGDCERVVIRGGGSDEHGGYRDSTGAIHGHYWVEATTKEGSFVLDVTADQFGNAPCLVSPIAEAAQWYIPGDQSIVDTHVAEEFGRDFPLPEVAHG